MNIRKYKQSQFELFPGAAGSSNAEGKSEYQHRNLNITIENGIVFCIIGLMAMVLVFSFGVERGKRLAKTNEMTEKIKDAQLKNDAIMVRSFDVENGTKTKSALDQKGQSSRVDEKREVLPISDDIKKTLEENYTIQVASFKLKANAQKEATNLRGKIGKDIFVLPKGSYSIVCVGRFAERNEAKAYARELSNRYQDYLIRRL